MLLRFQWHWMTQRLFYVISIQVQVKFFKKNEQVGLLFGQVGHGFNNGAFTLVCIAHTHLFSLYLCWPSEISATLYSTALPWALQHLLVGKLPAASPVPWKLMLWIMRFSRYLQVPWQIRVLDFYFYFIFRLVYEVVFSAAFPLWIFPVSCFIIGVCARSQPGAQVQSFLSSPRINCSRV